MVDVSTTKKSTNKHYIFHSEMFNKNKYPWSISMYALND